VDDTETCAATLDLALSAIPGVRTMVASAGVHALHVLRDETTPVCAVVTDLHMPRLDGFDLIRAIREDRRHAHVPIIVTSADTDPRTPRRTLDLGANAYFAKPYSPGLVRRKLEQLLHENRTSE
jgi:DNA-binding response OmpR family regulator